MIVVIALALLALVATLGAFAAAGRTADTRDSEFGLPVAANHR